MLFDDHIDITKYKIKGNIVKEGCNEMIQIEDLTNRKLYCAKYLSQEAFDQLNQPNIQHQIEIILKTNFPSLIEIIGCSRTDFKGSPQPIILTEYLSNGSLSDIIKCEHNHSTVPGWNNTKKLINLFGIASGMQFLHSLGFSNINLKLDNILLDENFYPKISNFCLTQQSLGKDDHNSNNSNIDDVYSFGSIAFEVIAPGNSMNDIPISDKSLIERCWSKDPKMRPTFDTIISELKNNKGFLDNDIDIEEFEQYLKLFENKSLLQPISIDETFSDCTAKSRAILGNDCFSECSTENELIHLSSRKQNPENASTINTIIDDFSELANNEKGTFESFSGCSTEKELMSVASEKRVPENASAITTITTFSDSQSQNQKKLDTTLLSDCSTEKDLLSVSENRIPENASTITSITNTTFSDSQTQNQKQKLDHAYFSECSTENELMHVDVKRTPENASTIDSIYETFTDCDSHNKKALDHASDCSSENEPMDLLPKKKEPMIPSPNNLSHDDCIFDCCTDLQDVVPSSVTSLGEEFFSDCFSETEAPAVEPQILETVKEIIEPVKEKVEPPPPPKEVIAPPPAPEVAEKSKCCLLI